MSWQILEGNCPDVLRELDAGSIQTCVTSPPYWGLRDYGTATWEGGDAECDHLGPPQQSAASTLRGNGHGGEKPLSRALQAQAVPERTCGKCGAKRIDSQLGLEPTPEQYVENLVAVFREVRRVLRDDGTVWLNLGDSYAGSWGNQGRKPERGTQRPINGEMLTPVHDGRHGDPGASNTGKVPAGLKPKDLVGIPWRVAFALQADGWWLRSDIIWAKPNPMPESVTDRPTRSHEYIFLLTKSARYFYDAEAIREGFADARMGNPGRYDRTSQAAKGANNDRADTGFLNNGAGWDRGAELGGRNRRSVWTVTTQPFPGAHFATFPPKLIEPCVLAGSPPKCCGECGAAWERITEHGEIQSTGGSKTGAQATNLDTVSVAGQTADNAYNTGEFIQRERITTGWRPTCDHTDDSGSATVLDPFAGAGTTGVVALRHNRNFVGVELNPEYAEMARNRIRDDAPLLNTGLEIAAVTTPETRRDF